MNYSIKEIFRYILAFFYPEYCPYCSALIEPDRIACRQCGKSVLGEAVTIRRGVRGARCVAPFAYEGKVRRAIVNFKFHEMGQYARPLGIVLTKTIQEEFPTEEIDLITFVPMYHRDEFKRGYNQSELLAKEVAERLSVPCRKTIKKIKRTKQQHKLKFSQRKKNLSGAFMLIDKESLRGKTILLIDDVMTSGITLSECVKKLYSAKPRQVYCAAVASAAAHERKEQE